MTQLNFVRICICLSGIKIIYCFVDYMTKGFSCFILNELFAGGSSEIAQNNRLRKVPFTNYARSAGSLTEAFSLYILACDGKGESEIREI